MSIFFWSIDLASLIATGTHLGRDDPTHNKTLPKWSRRIRAMLKTTDTYIEIEAKLPFEAKDVKKCIVTVFEEGVQFLFDLRRQIKDPTSGETGTGYLLQSPDIGPKVIEFLKERELWINGRAVPFVVRTRIECAMFGAIDYQPWHDCDLLQDLKE